MQSLVVAERLFEADEALDAAYREWQLVLNAYSNNPDTTVGFSLAELKRIEYRKTIQLIDDVVDRYASEISTNLQPIIMHRQLHTVLDLL